MTGIYRHYKGGLYVVLGTVSNSTNGPGEGDKLVLYYSLEKQKTYVREISQFNQRVQWPDGVPRARFEMVRPDGG